MYLSVYRAFQVASLLFFCLPASVTTTCHDSGTFSDAQKNQQIVVGPTPDVIDQSTLLCGNTAPERITPGTNQTVVCSNGPLVGRYITITSIDGDRLVLAGVSFEIEGWDN